MNKLNHIAFIMDGNGRWGKRKKRDRNFGHFKGVETVKKIVKNSIKLKIPILTFYVFSSENWKRPKKEINFLFKLLSIYIDKDIGNLYKKNIRINIIGDLKPFPKKLKLKISKVQKISKYNNKIQINMALNYGSKQEIIKSIKKILSKNKQINEKNIEKNLYTSGIPNPEVLIRTGNKNRISNFLIWQIAYTEIFFEKKMWPEFNQNDFNKIIKKYNKIHRNFGGLNVRTK